nr:hypothetical protein Iba_chr03aCG4160 [Ipomoea batatas]
MAAKSPKVEIDRPSKEAVEELFSTTFCVDVHRKADEFCEVEVEAALVPANNADEYCCLSVKDVLGDHLSNLVGFQVPNGNSGRDHGANLVQEVRRLLPAFSECVKNGSRPAGVGAFLPLQGRVLFDLRFHRFFLTTSGRGTSDLKVRHHRSPSRAGQYGRLRPLCRCCFDGQGRLAPSQGDLWMRLLRTGEGWGEAPLKNHSCKK